jgi:hypothetical protein
MTRRLLLTLTLAVTAACAPVAAADAALPAPYPSVSKVQPLSLGIGDTLKITGRNFTPGKNKNTVVFKRDGKKAIFAKASTATKTTLSVLVPEKLRTSLGKKNGVVVPTKFRLRVLSRRFAKSYTALTLSPTIAPARRIADVRPQDRVVTGTNGTLAVALAGGSAPAPAPAADCATTDSDNDDDLLSDEFEKAIGTDRCKADTDGDTMDDAWEYKSAFDLNQRSCPRADDEYPVPCAAATPYPGKKPYPNPRDGGDGNLDHDGDGMTALEEYGATRKHGPIVLTDLWYSAGLQASQDEGGDRCRGMVAPEVFNGIGVRPEFLHKDGTYPDVTREEYNAYSLDNLNRGGPDGCLHDGERDEDNDFLNNVSEAHTEMHANDFWSSQFSEPVYEIAYAGTDWLDSDSDGDGLVDGFDDQDHDDFMNVEEIVDRGNEARNKDDLDKGDRDGLWTDPFNPCLPWVESRTCPPNIPADGDVYMPFARYNAPLPKPRWPLYRIGHDPEDPNPNNPADPDTTSPEIWFPPVAFAINTPPDHPLPRCVSKPVDSCPNIGS